MKKAIILIFLAFGYGAKAQVVDTTITTIVACKIDSIKANYTDTLKATHLGIKVISDDLKSTATLYWVLLLSDGTQSTQGNYTIQGDEYDDWCNNSTPCNLWPFVLVGRKYGFTFIN